MKLTSVSDTQACFVEARRCHFIYPDDTVSQSDGVMLTDASNVAGFKSRAVEISL